MNPKEEDVEGLPLQNPVKESPDVGDMAGVASMTIEHAQHGGQSW